MAPANTTIAIAIVTSSASIVIFHRMVPTSPLWSWLLTQMDDHGCIYTERASPTVQTSTNYE